MNYLTKYMAFNECSIVVIVNMMPLLSFLFFSVGTKEDIYTKDIIGEQKYNSHTCGERSKKEMPR